MPQQVKKKLSILIPPEVDLALRHYAVDQRQDLSQVATAAFCRALGLDAARFGVRVPTDDVGRTLRPRREKRAQ
jgi:hypothetical protein